MIAGDAWMVSVEWVFLYVSGFSFFLVASHPPKSLLRPRAELVAAVTPHTLLLNTKV